jgi:hypothetical protein
MNEQQLQGLANHLNQSRAEFVISMKMVRDVLKALNENIIDFRKFLDVKTERVQETFDDEYLAGAARMVEAQEKFTASAMAVCEITDLLHARVQSVDDIGKHNESAKNILEMFPPFFAAYAETNANVEANTKKLDALSLTIERYFGSGQGLEYDN